MEKNSRLIRGIYFSIETRWDARTRTAKRVRSPSEEKIFKRLRWDHWSGNLLLHSHLLYCCVIDSSLITLICMLFPVSKQTACLRLSTHCRLVWDIVLQLSVWYCNNGRVINPESPEKHGVNFSKQARKKTKKGKKLSPHNILDRTNYLKFSFHCYILKFP